MRQTPHIQLCVYKRRMPLVVLIGFQPSDFRTYTHTYSPIFCNDLPHYRGIYLHSLDGSIPFWMLLGHFPGAKWININIPYRFPNWNWASYRETPTRILPVQWPMIPVMSRPLI